MAAPDYSNYTQEEIDAERIALAAERDALRQARVDHSVALPEIIELPDIVQVLREEQAPADAARQAEIDALIEDAPEVPEPWAGAIMHYAGMELEAIVPDESALIAISMLGMLDGQGGLQVEIFNEFIGNHLSQSSLASVIKAMTKPKAEVDLRGLVQALVDLRTKA